MPPAPIIFRVDASLQIGSGHVMRCLTLADALAKTGQTCHFICRVVAGHMGSTIEQRGHILHLLDTTNDTAFVPRAGDPPHAPWLETLWEEDAAQTAPLLSSLQPQWLIVDHYALDARWQQAVKPARTRLFVMDDLADRPHAADLLLDPSLGRNGSDYADPTPENCHKLIGPEHALLRPEFAEQRPASLARRQNPILQKILITMGGIDKDNATGQILSALNDSTLPVDTQITVVMGRHAPWLAQVQQQAQSQRYTTRVLVDVQNMAHLMVESDLAIGAAGSTAWERCCLGLPTIQLVLADNQRDVARVFTAMNAAIGVDSLPEIKTAIPKILAALHPDQMLSLSTISSRICTGRGVDHCLSRLLENPIQGKVEA